MITITKQSSGGAALSFTDVPNSHIQVAQGVAGNVITANGTGLDKKLFSAASNSIQFETPSKLRLGKNLQDAANQLDRYDVICIAVQNLSNQTETYRAVLSYTDVI